MKKEDMIIEHIEHEMFEHNWNRLRKVFNSTTERMKLEKIDVCPFCGSPDLSKSEEYQPINGKFWRFITCLNCGARGPVVRCMSEVDAWNRRVK